MSPKLTQNGSSLQIIIPMNICQTTKLKAGDRLHIMTDGETISMSKPKNEEAPVIANTVFTIGYESRTVEKFIARLKTHGVQQVIDVRERPLSRKKGFSKTALKTLLEEADINYVHMPELGSPYDIRQDLRNGGSESAFFDKYEKYVDDEVPSEIDLLDEYAASMPSALMCFELSSIHCHRKTLAKKLSNRGYNVIHL